VSHDERRAPSTLTLAGEALPDLRIVPREAVHLHEDADPARVERLAHRLRADGALRNPPAAAPLPGEGFVVLDGANRTSALARLGLRVLPLQVVEYDEPGVRLDVWRHLIVEPLDFAGLLRAKGLHPAEMSAAEAAGAVDGRTIAAYLLTGARALAVPLSPDRRLATILSQVVETYKGRARIYRVPTSDLEVLTDAYGTVAAVVVFPQLTKRDIMEIAGSPAKLPTGVTRHLIPGRALRVNVPLEVLERDEDLAAKNRWLAGLVRRRLLDHSVRHYPEGAFLFDE
jgi:hypothetical protein